MVFPDWVRQRTAELNICVIFLTRMPLPMPATIVQGHVSRALWAAPVVGAVIGAVGAAVYWLMHFLHVPAFPAAALAVVATVAATGALHEDGLADVADGFGGGATRERKLEIMRDSRIGAYGASALALSLLVRWSAISEFADPTQALLALIAAHAASRGLLGAFMHLLPPARSDGLSAGAGTVSIETAIAGAVLGAIPLLLLGLGGAVFALILLGLIFAAFHALCLNQIEGQTGDTVGALQQLGEIAILLVASVSLS